MNLLQNFAGSFTQSSQLKLHDADGKSFPARDFLGLEFFDRVSLFIFVRLSGQLAAIQRKILFIIRELKGSLSTRVLLIHIRWPISVDCWQSLFVHSTVLKFYVRW